MKIKKIELKNFRQFYGKQSIVLSNDKNKNITLIHGENNGGKTALLNAILWCFYEKTSHNFQNKTNLLNKKAKAEGDLSLNVIITIEVPSIEKNKKTNTIKICRTQNASQTSLGVYKITNGLTSKIDNPQFFVNSILPSDMAHHFFYQGEGNGTLNEATSFQNINKSIEEIQGISVAKKTLSDLKKIKRDYEKNMSLNDKSGEWDKYIKNKQNKEDQLALTKKRLEQAEIDLVNSKEAIEKADSLLRTSNSQTVKSMNKQREQNQALLKKTKAELHRIEEEKSRLMRDYSHFAFSNLLSEFDVNTIDTSELHTKHNFTVSKSLVNEILKQSKCICGTNLMDGSDSYNRIESLLKDAVDPDLKSRWEKSVNLLSSFTHKQQYLSSNIKSILAKKVKLEKEFDKFQGDLNEISQKLQNAVGLNDIAAMEKNRCLNDHKYEQSLKLKINSERDIRSIESDIKKIEKQIETFELYMPEMLKFESYATATQKIIDLISTELNKVNDNTYNRILRRMNEFLGKVSWQGYRAVTNENHSKIWLRDKDGKPADAGNGFQTMLAISFIISLIYLARERSTASGTILTPGTVAPFVADAPFGNLSTQNAKSMATNIAESVEQALFMLSTTHWTKDVDEGIRTKIGKEYNLVQYTTLSEEQFKESHVTSFNILNERYDVVRFDAEFDHVKIEEIVIND